MEVFLRARRPTGNSLEFHLFRPYFDLSSPVEQVPSHVLGVELAYRGLGTKDAAPIQNRPGRSFRARIGESVKDLHAYAIMSPDQLPARLRTPRWQVLCDQLLRFDKLGAPDQATLTTLLSTLGFYGTLSRLLPTSGKDDPQSLITNARIAHAQDVLNPQDGGRHQRSIPVLQQLVEAAGLPVQTRLGAAITLVVLHARGRFASAELVSRYSSTAARLIGSLQPDDDWRDTIHMSTYWRAVSFGPYLAMDVSGTLRCLDQAEMYARRLTGGSDEERWALEMNFHPLLETRSTTALWAKDLPMAARWAAELAERDPLDGKVHIRLGDVQVRLGRSAAAVRSYLTAAALGSPYGALGWSKAAIVTSDVALRRQALISAHQCDPYALTPLAELSRLGIAEEDSRLCAWVREARRSVATEPGERNR